MIVSTVSSIPTPREAFPGGMARAVASALQRCWVAYTTWRIERWAIRRLRAMSDRQLGDIGIVRSDIEFAVKRNLARDGRRRARAA
jgi:uncharacterized protein YjiS (DUF1127 family)